MKTIRLVVPALCVALLSASALLAAPRLVLNSSSTGTINVLPGSNGPAKSFEAYNAGDGSLSLTATTSASWLSASVGAVKACTTGNCNPVTITLNTASLAAGNYVEYVTLTDPKAVDSPQDITVVVRVAGVPDAVTIYVTPLGGAASVSTSPIFPTGGTLSATVATQSGGNWLSFMGNSFGGGILAGVPYLVSGAAQVGLGVGTYTGTVKISGSTVAAENKTINTTLVVSSSPIILLDTTWAMRVDGYQGGPKQTASLSFTNLGGGALNITGATVAPSACNCFSASGSGNTVTVTGNPVTAGVYSTTLTITSNAANNAQIVVPVKMIVAPAGGASINYGGIDNIVTYTQDSFSPGAIVAVFGHQFAPAASATLNAAGATKLATTLNGTQVLVNGVPAPLYYAGGDTYYDSLGISVPSQVNFQVPYSLSDGQVATVQVVANGTPGNLRSVNIKGASPKMMAFTAPLVPPPATITGGGYGIIVNATDGSLTLPSSITVPGFASHPAKPGDVLVIYAVGFGQTNPVATEGLPASSLPLQSIANATVTFGGGPFGGNAVAMTAAFAGLTPTAVGLYQMNVVVPADTPLGAAVPLTANINNFISNSVYVAISATGK